MPRGAATVLIYHRGRQPGTSARSCCRPRGRDDVTLEVPPATDHGPVGLKGVSVLPGEPQRVDAAK